jgi:hypothetical protein
MRPEHDSTQLRRYVLGALTEGRAGWNRARVLERADVLDRVCAAEDDLIEDCRIASHRESTSDSSGTTWPRRAIARA